MYLGRLASLHSESMNKTTINMVNTDLTRGLVTTVPVMLYNDCCVGAGASFHGKSELSNALGLYVSNESQAVDTYGKINCWEVSQVTDFSWLFYDSTSFNERISCWSVSGATDMSYMFYGARSFNQDIGEWDVSKVESMPGMFYYASSFNHDLSSWNTGQVKDFSHMFYGANKFKQNLCGWFKYFFNYSPPADSMFTYSGCVFQVDPIFATREHFCAKCDIQKEKRGMFTHKIPFFLQPFLSES
jgi:surface protein